MGADIDGALDLETIPEEAFDRPLEVLKRQTRRYRAVAAALQQLIEPDQAVRMAVRPLHGFVCLELPFDLQFREQVLLPTMARRAAPEDEFGRLRASLSAEYQALYRLCEPVGRLLDKLARARKRVDGVGSAIPDFVDRLYRVVSVESSILLPLARVRMHDDDLADLAAALQSSRRLMDHARNSA